MVVSDINERLSPKKAPPVTIAVIKAFVKESKELIAFRWLNRKNEDANIEYTRLSVMMNISVTLLVESVICVILGYGGYLVYSDVFDAGQLEANYEMAFNGASTDLSGVEQGIETLIEQNKVRVVSTPWGRIEYKGNNKRIIRNG